MRSSRSTSGALGPLACLLAAALCSLASFSAAKPRPRVLFDSPLARVDAESLESMLERVGELGWVQRYRDGSLKQATFACLVQAPPRWIWRFLTDYSHHPDFVPGLLRSEVLAVRGARIDVKVEIDLPGDKLELRLRHHHTPYERIHVELLSTEGPLSLGEWRWELVPASRQDRTILCYHLHARAAGQTWLDRLAGGPAPGQVLLNTALGLQWLHAIRRQAERERH
ncbi:MAG: hypothetical protein JXR96_19115 [Deltaproteobacteria bacterium]|nr:hypothetical protein [Deltaproteobacteria bacterium]